MSERLFWQTIHRSLIAIAKAIEVTKLKPAKVRGYTKIENNPIKAAEFFAAQGCRVKGP